MLHLHITPEPDISPPKPEAPPPEPPPITK